MFVCCRQYCCYTFLVVKTILNHANFSHKSSFIIDEKWMHGKVLEKCYFCMLFGVITCCYCLMSVVINGIKYHHTFIDFLCRLKKKIALSGVVIKINRNNLFCLLVWNILRSYSIMFSLHIIRCVLMGIFLCQTTYFS